jgi:riboflavin kinase/FMN adenylyltransferase
MLVSIIKTMQLELELSEFGAKRDTLLTIGVFDGVHPGHRHLLAHLTRLARRLGLASMVLTFRRHPQEVLQPHLSLPLLTSFEQRVELLKKEGVDEVIGLTFTPRLAQFSPEEFLGLLKKYLRMRGLVVGPDFALGRNREGDVATLTQLGKALGFSVTVVPPFLTDGEVVSSTAIREALAEGDMKRVQKLLGRPFSLKGEVVAGDGRGAKLGFPTANVNTEAELAMPPEGVYVSRAHIEDQSYPAMTNIGVHPTFGGSQRLVEVHIIDYDGDLYGQEISIDLINRLRDEKKFKSPEALQKQMAEDVRQGRSILNDRGGS